MYLYYLYEIVDYTVDNKQILKRVPDEKLMWRLYNLDNDDRHGELIEYGEIKNGFNIIQSGIDQIYTVLSKETQYNDLVWGISLDKKYTFLPEISFDI